MSHADIVIQSLYINGRWWKFFVDNSSKIAIANLPNWFLWMSKMEFSDRFLFKIPKALRFNYRCFFAPIAGPVNMRILLVWRYFWCYLQLKWVLTNRNICSIAIFIRIGVSRILGPGCGSKLRNTTWIELYNKYSWASCHNWCNIWHDNENF